MGREIQKRKARSGIAKIRHKPKSKKLLLSNPLIAKNWNKSETLSQNYARLGLARKLNGHTGGVEMSARSAPSQSGTGTSTEGAGRPKDALDVRATNSVKAGKRNPVGEGEVKVQEVRIVRDNAGKIVKVLEEEGKEKAGHWAKPLDDALNAFDDPEYDSDHPFSDDDDDTATEARKRGAEDRAGHRQHVAGGFVGSALAATEGSGANAMVAGDGGSIVGQLTAAAAMPGHKKVRKQSDREREWCEALVAKHGRSGFAAMARDAKLNVMQQSEGDVRRRVVKYLKWADREHEEE